MKKYVVMGEHPGDGSVQEASNAIEAFAKHVRQDCPEIPLSKIVSEIKLDIKEHRIAVTVEGNTTLIGSYEMKEVKG